MTVDRDTRPTQAEVEAVAEGMYGADWKAEAEALIRRGNEIIATRLDSARAVFMEQRR